MEVPCNNELKGNGIAMVPLTTFFKVSDEIFPVFGIRVVMFPNLTSTESNKLETFPLTIKSVSF